MENVKQYLEAIGIFINQNTGQAYRCGGIRLEQRSGESEDDFYTRCYWAVSRTANA